jgi:hypothetical protein
MKNQRKSKEMGLEEEVNFYSKNRSLKFRLAYNEGEQTAVSKGFDN